MRSRLGIVVLALGLVQIAAYFLVLHVGGAQMSYGCFDQDCYAQAARRIVAGCPFSFAPGEPASTGSTSVLYPFVLAVPMALGMRGPSIHLASFVLNAFFYLVFLLAWTSIIVRLINGGIARIAAVIALGASGVCAYVAFTQCDQGLWMAVSALLTLAIVAKRRGYVACLLAIAPWVRPEGMMYIVAYGAVALAIRERDAALPFAVGFISALGVFVLNFVLTGELQFSSVASKGYFQLMGFEQGLVRTLKDGLSIVGAYLFSLPFPKERFFSLPTPVISIAFWFGLVAMWRRHLIDRRVSVFALAAVMAAGVVSLGGFAQIDFDRYLAWIMPITFVFAGYGLQWISDRIRSSFWRKLPIVALAVTVIPSALGMALMMNEVAPARYEFFKTVRETGATLPEGASVGSLDFVWAYELPSMPYHDITGLFSPAFRGVRTEENAFEMLRHRPDLRFTHWVTGPIEGEHTNRKRFGRRWTFGEGIGDGLSAEMVMKADFSAYDRGVATPSVPAEWRLTDSMDVAYLPDEVRCARCASPGNDNDFATFLTVANGTNAEDPLLDCGRFVNGWEEFTLACQPERDALLVLRTIGHLECRSRSQTHSFTYSSPRRLELYADGQKVADLTVEVSDDVFSDFQTEIPARFVKSSSLRLRVCGRFVSYGYHLFQR